MKTQFFIAMTALLISCASLAEMAAPTTTSNNQNADLKPLSGVRVSMQRMLKSGEGRYFLSLYAGIANPHAELTDFMEKSVIDFKGTQKGDQLDLKSTDGSTSANQYQLTGTLNANSGMFKVLLSDSKNTFGNSMQFEPAFKVENKPVFIFKFYGQNDANPYGKTLKRVDVLNKNNNTVVQSLTGFSAYPNSVGYLDINFDGYYDVILSDISQDRKVEDKRYVYWIFNPQTQKFQRSSQLDKIVGFPGLHGEKQQIDFGNGQVYQVEKGLLNRVSVEN